MIETKKPKVILYNHTPDPYRTVALPVSAWTSDNFVDSIDEFEGDLAVENSERAIKAFHKVALEYVDTIWIIKNCSRAFQQQLTRTRLASYSIQSMRVVTKKGFAINGHYTMPPSLNGAERRLFHNMMLDIQATYHKAIKMGVSAEDARGMLPLNIHSDISMRINLASLYHMLRQRLCVNTQWEYRQVARQIKQILKEKFGPLFSDPIDAPCVHVNKCPMREEYCGVEIWKMSEDRKMNLYRDFVKWRKEDKEWIITYLKNDGYPMEFTRQELKDATE